MLFMQFRCFQSFECDVTRRGVRAADIISAVEFDDSGQFLATGDRGGRVVIFERGGSTPVTFLSANLLSQL